MASGKFNYGWIVLLAAFVIGVTGSGVQLSFGVFFKSLEAYFNLTRASTSTILSAHLLLSLVFSIVGGWALDHYGPRTVLILMGVFTGLSQLLASQAGTLWHLFASYSLLAMGVGAIFPVLTSIASRWFIRGRGLAVGITISGLYIGMMVVSPISAYLISNYGWRMSYFILSLVAFLGMVPAALLVRRAPGEVTISSATDSRREAAHVSPENYSLRQATRAGNFWTLFFIWSLGGFCYYIIAAHAVPYAGDLGIAPTMAALVLSIFAGASIIGSVLVGVVSDRVGRKKTVASCSLLMAAAMLLLGVSSSLWMLYLSAVLSGFAFGGFIAPLGALTGDTFGLRHLGKIAAVLEAGWMLGGAIGPALAGYLFDISGNYLFAFMAGMAAALASAGLVLLFRTAKV
ncbi:MAG: MFS transporter [Chloroflexi bacterium]|nr:MFS transporter [Chloroflexota bacterium]